MQKQIDFPVTHTKTDSDLHLYSYDTRQFTNFAEAFSAGGYKTTPDSIDLLDFSGARMPLIDLVDSISVLDSFEPGRYQTGIVIDDEKQVTPIFIEVKSLAKLISTYEDYMTFDEVYSFCENTLNDIDFVGKHLGQLDMTFTVCRVTNP